MNVSGAMRRQRTIRTTTTRRPAWVFRVGFAALLISLLVGGANVSAAIQNAREAARLTAVGTRLIEEERLREAVQELDNAIQADAEHWEAFYQKGRALGLLERYLEARDALLIAAELNPGHAHTHYLAWLAAARIGDYENAWDQAIRASLAGMDMNDKFMDMFYESEPPVDFAQRVRAPKIYVAEIDTGEVFARAEQPFNRNPMSGGDPTLSGRSSDVMGVDRVMERQLELTRVQRLMREELSDSPYFGVVLRPDGAKYSMVIAVDAIGETAPVELETYIRLLDIETGETAYNRRVMFRDITAETVLYGEIKRFAAELELWLENSRNARD